MRKVILSFVALTMGLMFTAGRPETKVVQEKRTIYTGIAFYNLENLFDTIHDEGKNDYEFLPNGGYHWGSVQYTNKIANMSRVLSELCTERVKGGAAFIGVSEVENSRVMEDLVKSPALAKKGFKFIHYEGDDRRGVDVACLYNPNMFKPTKSELISTTEQYKAFSNGHITRGVLHVEGSLLGEPFHFLVNHWPSRGAGSESREWMGRFVRGVVDSIQAVHPDARIMIMGDLNDDPDNKSVKEALGVVYDEKKVKSPKDLFDPWYNTLRKKGQGTLLWDGMWNLFDQIILTSNLIGKDRSTFKFFKNEIYMPDYIISKSGRTKGGPFRTTASGVWQNGYSDHFPTQVYIAKDIER
ncbi:MAG: endonuclease/exonuclease/phosphatase family protein [Bacteroidaceae bacterium]|nr:endonuclease/exonuclease/phosphatase family protein [Bacteroidaceae bacterium]